MSREIIAGNVRLLLTASIFMHAGVNMIAPLYAVYIGEIGGTLLDAGLAVGVYGVGKSFFYFLAGRVNEQLISRKALIVTGYFLHAFGYFCYLFAENIWHVIAIQALLAFAEAIMNPSWSAILATSLTKGKERRIYGDFYGYRTFFEGVAAILGGLFAMQMGFTVVFSVMVGAMIVAGCLSLKLVE